jgi:hypothetical protein
MVNIQEVTYGVNFSLAKKDIKSVSMLLFLKISFKEKKLLIKRIEQLEKEKYEK